MIADDGTGTALTRTPPAGATKAWRDAVAAVRPFAHDETGDEVLEFSLALAFFAVLAIVGLHLIPQVANNQVTTDDNNFSQSLANGY
jgi:hypothetical protein